MENFQPEWLEVPTPSFLVEEKLLRKNLAILKELREETGAKILLAQKCFSMYYFYPLIMEYLDGMTASGLYEALLAYEEMGKRGENHIFSPAFKDEDFPAILEITDHIVFNSISQVKKFAPKAKAENISCGLRINPEHSTQEHEIYDPCAPSSRLGVKLADFDESILPLIDGLHFHTLCEQGAEPLAETLAAVEEKFGKYLPQMKWLNFGGGHHITRADYNIPLLKKCIKHVQDEYNLTVYIEPGEAVALNAGYLVSSVLDILPGGKVILDTSAACHMPDVIEMPYRPPVINSGEPNEFAYTYTFGGQTCLAGDVIGTYSFKEPLKIGDRIIFGDMAIYSMVKTNTFNGMPLPNIIAVKADGSWEVIRKFGYEDFKMRL